MQFGVFYTREWQNLIRITLTGIVWALGSNPVTDPLIKATSILNYWMIPEKGDSGSICYQEISTRKRSIREKFGAVIIW
jgi:hypothetical protein